MRIHKLAAAALSALLTTALVVGMLPLSAAAASSAEIQKDIDALKAKNKEIQKQIDGVQSQYNANMDDMKSIVEMCIRDRAGSARQAWQAKQGLPPEPDRSERRTDFRKLGTTAYSYYSLQYKKSPREYTQGVKINARKKPCVSSSIQTILSVSEFHRFNPIGLADFTAGGELRPALKILIQLSIP